MNQDLLLRRIAENEQKVAVRDELVVAGAAYALTSDQVAAIADLAAFFEGGGRSALLHAPTGAGKTAVAFHIAIGRFLATRKPVFVLAPTRDLARQDLAYFADRLVGTPLRVEGFHGGIDPKDRAKLLRQIADGILPFVVASGLMLEHEELRIVLRTAGLIVVDDVNAFDARKHLGPLKGLNTAALYASATPAPVESLLKAVGAMDRVVTLGQNPFMAPATTLMNRRARPGEGILDQVMRVESLVRTHLENEGRIYVIVRTRAQVGRLARALEDRFKVPVMSLHGDMVDTREQARRMGSIRIYDETKTRVAMLEKFRATRPAMLVGTNILGSGLDVPDADLVVITDSEAFGEAELEQLVGRVGRRDAPSEACMIVGAFQPKARAAAAKKRRKRVE